MFKNVASQSIALYAFDDTTGAPKTGDAANMVYYITKDWGSVTAIAASSGVPTEVDSTNAKGWYKIAVSQTETNADAVLFTGKSSTANIVVNGQLIYTDPPNYTTLSVDGSGRVDVIKVAGTTQTARDIGASVLLSTGTGTGQLDFTSGVVKANATQFAGQTITAAAGVTIPTSIASPTNITAASGVALATGQKVDVDTIKTNPVVNAGTVTFPTSATLASTTNITAAVGITVSTNSDKTGYSLTQTFPTNFSAMSIDSNGNVAQTSNIKKNTAKAGFMFVMTDSTTHAPKTGVTVTSTRSIDGAAFASTTNSATEVAVGTYVLNLSAADTNGDHIMLRFTGTASDDLNIEIVTQP